MILDSQADAALNSLLSLLDRLLDEHLIRLGVTDEQRRWLNELCVLAGLVNGREALHRNHGGRTMPVSRIAELRAERDTLRARLDGLLVTDGAWDAIRS